MSAWVSSSLVRGIGTLAAFLALGADDRWLDRGSRVEVQFNPRIDFSGFETYYWHHDQRMVADRGHHLRVVVAVQRRMSALGYRVDVRDPDLRALYEFEIGETEVSRQMEDHPPWDVDQDDDPWVNLIIGLVAAALADDRTVEHLELTVTLFDTETNWLAYRASGTFPWSDDDSEWILHQACATSWSSFRRAERAPDPRRGGIRAGVAGSRGVDGRPRRSTRSVSAESLGRVPVCLP